MPRYTLSKQLDGGRFAVGLFCALFSVGGGAATPQPEFPFLPNSKPYVDRPVVSMAERQACLKSPRCADEEGGTTVVIAPPEYAPDAQKKEIDEDELGFNMEIGANARNLEFMGPFGQVLHGPLPMASVHLEMNEDEAMALFYKPANDESFFPATLTQGDEWLKGSISVKGSSTRGFIKKSLLFKLYKGSKGDWYGYRRVSLNSMATDPSMLREWISWDLARASGINSLNTFYTRLYINRKYVGLFLFTEWLFPAVFDRVGLGADGQLFQPLDSLHCGDLSALSLENKCYAKLSPPDTNFSSLDALVQGVNSTTQGPFYHFVDENFYGESLLNWIAVNGIVLNGDTYNKNYFLYLSHRTGQWAVMPWDYDLSFGRSYDPFFPPPRNVFNDNFVYYYMPDIGFHGQIKVKLLEDQILFAQLKRHIAHLLGVGRSRGDARTYGWFSPERVAARINVIQNYTLQDAQKDTFSPHRIHTYEEQAEAMKYFALARYAFLKETTVGPRGNWQFTYDPNQVMAPAPAVPSTLKASWTVKREGYDRPLVDSTGKIVTVLRVREIAKPMTIHAKVLSFQPPPALPLDKVRSQCLLRTWELTTEGPALSQIVADVKFEYMQENSQNSEAKELEGNQKDLQLWMRDGDVWAPLFTRVNSLAKTLASPRMVIPANRTLQFVACVDPSAYQIEPIETEYSTTYRRLGIPNEALKTIREALNRGFKEDPTEE